MNTEASLLTNRSRWHRAEGLVQQFAIIKCLLSPLSFENSPVSRLGKPIKILSSKGYKINQGQMGGYLCARVISTSDVQTEVRWLLVENYTNTPRKVVFDCLSQFLQRWASKVLASTIFNKVKIE